MTEAGCPCGLGTLGAADSASALVAVLESHLAHEPAVQRWREVIADLRQIRVGGATPE